MTRPGMHNRHGWARTTEVLCRDRLLIVVKKKEEKKRDTPGLGRYNFPLYSSRYRDFQIFDFRKTRIKFFILLEKLKPCPFGESRL